MCVRAGNSVFDTVLGKVDVGVHSSKLSPSVYEPSNIVSFVFFCSLRYRPSCCIINSCDDLFFAFVISWHSSHNIQCLHLKWLGDRDWNYRFGRCLGVSILFTHFALGEHFFDVVQHVGPPVVGLEILMYILATCVSQISVISKDCVNLLC